MKKALALTLILALLFLVVAGTQVVSPVNANFGNLVETPPPAGTEPPTISIVSPEDKVYTTRELTLAFNVGRAIYKDFMGGMPTVYYKADWMQNGTFVGYGASNYTIKLTDVPDGMHNVTVRVTQPIVYDNGSGAYWFNTENQLTVKFTVAVSVQPVQPSDSFPTAYSMGIVATIVLVLLGLTVYILKRKD